MAVPHVRRRTRAAGIVAAAAAAVTCLATCAPGEAPIARAHAVVQSPDPVVVERVAAPAPPAAVDPLADLPVLDTPEEEGLTFASLRVPRWGEDYDMPITEGITDHVLDMIGMGRFPDSEMPGQEGNFAVAGHRTDGSRPLALIDELELGDELHVVTDVGTYTYEVSGTEIVTPDQVRVVEPNPETGGEDAVGRLLTLVACHPWASSAYRYILHAELADFVPA